MPEFMQRVGQLCSKIWAWIKFLITVLQQIAEKNRKTNSTTYLQYQLQHVRDLRKHLYNNSDSYSWASHSSSTPHQTEEPSRHSEYTGYCSHHQQRTAYLKCANPSCEKTRWRDQRSSKYFDYCSTKCRDKCRRDSWKVIRKARPENFQKVQSFFFKRWHQNKGTCGELHKVLTINNPKLQRQFEDHLSTCSDPTVFVCYHGTSLKCPIYDNISVCNMQTCGVCGIIQNGFLKKFISYNISYQRYGDAFYFAVNSSKSHDYTQGYGKYRAILLCKVVVGRRYVTKSNHCDLKTPPSGYDSVHGKRGGTLNYDEIVIYNPEAILPTHVLLYTKDGIHKIAR